MLTSIHPLGERARGNRFGLTASAYVVGSLAGGAMSGLVAGALGALRVGGASLVWRSVVFALASVLALVVELRGIRPRSWRRQVNEDWLSEYRGWVYGIGFGFQLGLGVATIVTSAVVYLAFFGAFLTAVPVAGALVGAAFGIARALPLFGVRSVETPESLRVVHTRVRRLDQTARRVTVGAELTLGLVLLLVAVGR
jgi:sulfite exporter TauE/SafE